MNPEEIESLVRAELASAGPDSRRLFHGRGRTLLGWEQVTIDYFRPFILITLFDDTPAAEATDLAQALSEWGAAAGVTAVAVQSRTDGRGRIDVMVGDLPRKPIAHEAGLDFGLQLDHRQNLGFFLDMACARRWLQERAEGKRVLNLFAYTCAFSVVACAGGAHSVVNLDMASAALRLGQQNHQRNGFNTGVSYLGHNLFRSWSKLRRAGPFDVLVVDPPTRQPGSFVAESDYQKVISKLPGLCAPGADLLLCLNSPHLETAFLQELVAEYAPGFEFQQRLANPDAFIDVNPELGLKVLWYRSP